MRSQKSTRHWPPARTSIFVCHHSSGAAATEGRPPHIVIWSSTPYSLGPALACSAQLLSAQSTAFHSSSSTTTRTPMAATQKVALVTGAARPTGIGRGICKAFTAAGWSVVAVDSQPAAAPSTDYARFVQADISSPDQVLALRQRLDAEGVSQLHALVNNAGISDPYMQTASPGQAFQERAQRWQSYINTNLSGAFLVTEALLPLMPAKQSSIIHISSTRARQSEPDSEGYASAKAGLIGLTHAQASTLAGKARVNCILPGWIDTSDGEFLRQQDHEWHWTGSVGRPSDIAELCLFLADEAKSGFITGQEFVVDGGVTRRMHYPE